MANDFFRFKQFTIHQDKSAMKVCTDACLFGAWASHQSPLTNRRLLDIGTGTGLLALMYAQKNADANIDAVEVDKAAAKQANENFQASPWKQRLRAINLPIQEFVLNCSTKYDVIISNPPFYENELKSENQKRNIALHSEELSLEELVSAVAMLLLDDGIFFILLPYYRTKYFEELATKHNLFIKEKILVKQSARHNYFRSMLCLARNFGVTAEQEEITITNAENKYTLKFTELLKEYYLNL